ncbi:MAG: ABC transporter substrate-binding protein [Acetobacteraceae bacterium]
MSRLATVLCAALLAPFAAMAQNAAPPLKIGVLTDLSGPAFDATGEGSVVAAQMAVADYGGKVLGRPIEVISGNEQMKPDIGAAIARQWFDRDGVDLIEDVPVSSVGLAVQQIAREQHKLFITQSTLTSDFTGKFCSPYTMQWSFDAYALAAGTAQAVTKRGGKSWFFLTADYAFGYSLEHDATEFIKKNGGTVVGSVRFPLAASDLTAFLLKGQQSGANILGIAGGPPDNVNFIKLGSEFGVVQRGQQFAGLLMLITDIHALGLKAAQGLLLTTGFYWDMDDQARAWSKRFFEKRHAMPTAWQAGVYSSVTHYLKAVAAVGGTDPLQVAAKMRELPIDDFFARHAHLRPDGLMVHDLYLVQVKSPDESKYPWDYYKILDTIPGDQAFPPADAAVCSLDKP